MASYPIETVADLLDYDAGQRANFAGYARDETQTPAWQQGWLDAEQAAEYAASLYLHAQAEH